MAIGTETLQRGLRDLVALTALPAVWAGKQPHEIAESLSDVMLTTSRLDLVYILLKRPPPCEVVRTGQQLINGQEAQEIGKAFAPWLTIEVSNQGISISSPFNGGFLQIIVIPLGQNAIEGFAVAGTQSPDTLAGLDRLLLSVAANQAVTAIQQARLYAALEKQTVELANTGAELQKFNYIAGHDLQEPLRKIQLLSTRLQARYSSKNDDEFRDYLKRIQGAASRAQSLVQDVLLYSKIARSLTNFIRVDLNQTLQDVLETLSEQIDSTGATIETDMLPILEADALQMEHLFQNLVQNALKYHQPGIPPVVKIYAEVADGHCKIYVADNGIGFEEKYREKIFEVFERLDRKQDGSGVGLTICRKIVERHAGRIEAAGIPNKGATFKIILPLYQNH